MPVQGLGFRARGQRCTECFMTFKKLRFIGLIRAQLSSTRFRAMLVGSEGVCLRKSQALSVS